MTATTHFISAGASQRCNIMDCIEEVLVYASFSNIILVKTNTKKEVIVRDSGNDITFLVAKNKNIIICDVIGNIEVYTIKNNLEFKQDFKCCIGESLFGVIFTGRPNYFITIGLDNIIHIQGSTVINTIHVSDLLTTLCSATCNNNDFYIFGYNNGSIEIYNSKFECLISKKIHKDSIKCIKVRFIDEQLHFITSSLDFTVKIWKMIITNENVELIMLACCFGHVAWVNGCNWIDDSKIISCSADNSLIIWKKIDKKWVINNKLGGLCEKNQAFYNCLHINEDIFVQSTTGGIYRYQKDNFRLLKFASGHVGEITSIDVKKDMILTTSLDYTARIFSFELREEIGRPQIHGYPITCARFLKMHPLEIISGADETVLRTLKSTQIFIYNYINALNELLFNKSDKGSLAEYITSLNSDHNTTLPKMSRLSELSLTTEIFDQDYFTILEEGNNERNLSLNFIFAEINKLYGHFFEITDIAVSDRFIISANKATNIKFSGIFVWNHEFEKIDYISVHRLGIQRLKFSVDGQFIIACSRDTSVSLYKLENDKFIHKTTFNIHSRIVWDCDISFDNLLAASCSRDKKLCIYDLQSLKEKEVIMFEHELTALCFHKSSNILCLGFSNGFIEIFEVNESFKSIGRKRVHSGNVKCLSFVNNVFVCSGGDDGMFVINDFGMLNSV